MKINKPLCFLLLLLMLLTIQTAFANDNLNQDIPVLCYHNVGPVTNTFTVTPNILEAHFEYLKENGYTPITLEQYLSASERAEPLPPKPVMLTFDDGYQSFYTKVFPLLQKYQYPAMMAIVTSWLDHAPADVAPTVTWEQLRIMENSGLVTLASHSHQAHRFAQMNPQGDRSALLAALEYQNGQYESPEDYHRRIRSDLKQSQNQFIKELGHPVKAMVWPYGASSRAAIDIALQEGFSATFILSDGFNRPGDKALQQAQRIIITGNPDKKAFAQLLKTGGKNPVTAAQVDIDMLYDPGSPAQTEENITRALERLAETGVNTVYLQAFSDENGSGNIESVYFYTTAAPVKANLFSHIAARFQNEGNFAVYAWMPTLAAQWLLQDHPENTVTAWDNKNKGWYNRATPFSPLVEERLVKLFSDLAAYNNISGVLFQDDLYLNDYEDFSQPAQRSFQAATGLSLTPEILKDPKIRETWTQLKTDRLTNLTVKLSAAVKQYRPDAAIARNLYPTLIMEPESQEWLAQNYAQYLTTYDYTVVMAYPYLEKQDKAPEAWLEALTSLALKDKDNAAKTVFKLQTYDWNAKRWLSAKEIQKQTAALKKSGAVHIAYYPEKIFP